MFLKIQKIRICMIPELILKAILVFYIFHLLSCEVEQVLDVLAYLEKHWVSFTKPVTLSQKLFSVE